MPGTLQIDLGFSTHMTNQHLLEVNDWSHIFPASKLVYESRNIREMSVHCLMFPAFLNLSLFTKRS